MRHITKLAASVAMFAVLASSAFAGPLDALKKPFVVTNGTTPTNCVEMKAEVADDKYVTVPVLLDLDGIDMKGNMTSAFRFEATMSPEQARKDTNGYVQAVFKCNYKGGVTTTELKVGGVIVELNDADGKKHSYLASNVPFPKSFAESKGRVVTLLNSVKYRGEWTHSKADNLLVVALVKVK